MSQPVSLGSDSSTSFDSISSDVSLFFRPPLHSFPHSTQVYSTNLTSSLIFSVVSAGRTTDCFRKENSQFKRLNYPSLVFRHSSPMRDRLRVCVRDSTCRAALRDGRKDEASDGVMPLLLMCISGTESVSLSFPYLMLCDVVMEKRLAIESPRSQAWKQRGKVLQMTLISNSPVFHILWREYLFPPLYETPGTWQE